MSTNPPLYLLVILFAVSVIGTTCVQGIYLQSNDDKLTTAASNASTTTVSPNTNEKSNQAVGLVHPTFITATLDSSQPCKPSDKCYFILETRARAYKLAFSTDDISKGSLVSTGTFKNPHNVREKIVAKDSLGTIVTHKALAEFVKNGINNATAQSTDKEFNFVCLNSLYRAFERFKSEDKHYFVGMVDQGSICLGVYKSETKMETGEVNNFSDLLKGLKGLYLRRLIEESEESIYKYSSMAVAELDSSRVRVFLFDEAGGMISTVIPRSYFESSGPTDTSIGTETLIYSMSAVQLANLRVKMPFVKEDISSSMKSLIDKTGSDGKNGIQRMRSSFRLGFIESITLISDKTLCWSSTMRKHKSKGINCLSVDKDEKASKTLNGLLESFSKGSIQVLAMAVGESSMGSHYHVVHANSTGWNYLMCSVSQKMGSTNASKPSKNSAETTETQNCTQRNLGEKSGIERIIDIVQWKSPSCPSQKMVVLYQYGYKVNEPQSDLFCEKSTIPAPWMTFFANAAMAKGDKFYFFSGGNILITMDLASSSKCSDTLEFNPSSYREFQASELIRLFGESLSSGPPVYLGYQEYDALSKTWTPDINEGPKRIPSDTSLTGAGTKGKGNSAGIMIILILLIIFIVLGVLFYYIFFGRQSGKSPSTKSMRQTSDVSSVNSAKSVRSVMSPPGLSKVLSNKSPDLSHHKSSQKSHSKKSSTGSNSKRTKKSSKLSSISDKKLGSKSSKAKSSKSGSDKLKKKKSKKSKASKSSPRSPASRPKAISFKRPT